MSDSHEAHEAHEGHTGPIKTPKQLIWAVVASFVVPIIVIILLVNYVAMGDKTGAGSRAMDAEAIAKRIAPVARVELKDASDAAAMKTENPRNAPAAAGKVDATKATTSRATTPSKTTSASKSAASTSSSRKATATTTATEK